MSRAARVLIVDDNAANRALAQAALEDEDYRLVLAEDGEQALGLIEAEPPDCVLLDVRMPRMDGFEVCRRIRQGKHGSEMPVVFLTAQRDVDTFDAAREAGGDDFLTKPLEPAELVVRVRAALQLGRLNAKLRQQVELMKKQRDDLVRERLLKERLTAFLVHDLKNPVNSLDLRAQQALRDPGLPERARRSLLHIRDESRTLSRLILNLLDISRSDEAGLPVRTSDVCIDELTSQVVEELALRAEGAGVSLERQVQRATFACDADLLRRVIANLVENAIRHAPEDSAVRVTATCDTDGHLCINVSDQGPGVPPEQRERIFDPFVQLDSGDLVVTRLGRGLGLTFCRVAVEAHGGRIWIEDGNPGATFAMALPGAR
jgi:signal transduction histidine kinase